MGNMAPYPILYNGKIWRTSEALFQAMRFNDIIIQEAIRKEKSPMGAKLKAKSFKDQMVIVPMSPQDVANMEKCVLLKFQQHPTIADLLRATRPHPIYEDAKGRNKVNDLFWGAHPDPNDPTTPEKGLNVMGEILMKVRQII
jgi:ribA/ribD-fused uncharacterized protein